MSDARLLAPALALVIAACLAYAAFAARRSGARARVGARGVSLGALGAILAIALLPLAAGQGDEGVEPVSLTQEELTLGVVLFVVAFLPPILYMVWIRNLERHGREPWKGLTKAFVWGAVGGVILGVIISVLLFPVALDEPAEGDGTRPDDAPLFGNWRILVAAVIVAPVAEEFAKALGLGFVRDRHPEPEDGLVYGAAAGFGFAATENLFYGIEALATTGVGGYVVNAILRTISSALLHGSASALVGYAIWARRAHIAGFGNIVKFYLFAVILHGLYNLAASTGEIIGGIGAALLGLAFAVGLALYVFGRLRKHVRRLDRRSGVVP